MNVVNSGTLPSDIDSTINLFKNINASNSNGKRYIKIENDQIKTVDDPKQASKISIIDEFIFENIIEKLAAPYQKQYQLVNELKKYYDSLLKEQGNVVEQYAGIWATAISFLYESERAKATEATVCLSNLQNTYNTLQMKIKELGETLAKMDQVEMQKKIVALNKYKPEYEKIEKDLREKTIRLSLDVAKTKPYVKSLASQPSLTKKVFNLALRDAEENAEITELNTKYKGNYNIQRSLTSAHYSVRLLNQIIFEKDFSSGIQKLDDIRGLSRICQHRNNFLHYSSKLEKIQDGVHKPEVLVKEIQENIDLLSDSKSNKVVTLKDNKSTCFVLPGGWKGHYISYEFRKEGEDYFFMIHNRGEHSTDRRLHKGISFKDSTTGKTYSKTTVRIKTTKEALKNPLFLHQIINASITEDATASSKQAYDDIYDHFITKGNGTIVESEVEKELEKIQTKIAEINAKNKIYKKLPKKTSADMRAISKELKQRDILQIQALELLKRDSCFQSQQLYGTCTESNFLTVEEDIASSFTRNCLERFTLAQMVNKVCVSVLKGKYAEEIHFVSLLTKHTDIRLKKQLVQIQAYQQLAALESITEADLYAVLSANPSQKKILSNVEKAAVVRDIQSGLLNYQYLPKFLRSDQDIALAAVKKDALAIKHVLNPNQQVVEEALKFNVDALKYASEEIQEKIIYELKDKNGLLKWVKINGLLLMHTKNPTLPYVKLIVKEAVTNNGLALKYASDTLQNNWDIVLTAIKQNPKALAFASDEIKNGIKTNPVMQKNKEFVLAVIKMDPTLFRYASEELRRDPEVAIAAIKGSNKNASFIPNSLLGKDSFVIELLNHRVWEFSELGDEDKQIKNIVLAAVKIDGNNLKLALPIFQNDPEFIMLALKTNPMLPIPPNVSAVLGRDEIWMMDAVKVKGQALVRGSQELRNNKKLVMAAVSQDGLALEHASEAMREDLDVVLQAIKQNPNAVKFAAPTLYKKLITEHPELTFNKPFMEALVTKDASMFEFASGNLKRDKQFVLLAVNRDGDLLKFVSPELQADKEVVLIAVKWKAPALKYASAELKKDKQVLLAAFRVLEMNNDKELFKLLINDHPGAIAYGTKEIQNDKEIGLVAVKKDAKLYFELGFELRKDFEVIDAMLQQDLSLIKHVPTAVLKAFLDTHKEYLKDKSVEKIYLENENRPKFNDIPFNVDDDSDA